MAGTRSRTARGLVVLAVAGGLTAGALLVPAGAASFATKKFVKKQVAKVAKRVTALEGTVADLNQLIYVQGPQVTVPDSSIGQAEAVCPAGSFAVGGGGSVSLAMGIQIDSYPSQGVGFTLPSGAAPIGHTGWAFEYAATEGDETIRAYVICAKVDSVTGFAPGGPPGRRTA
jgi:hypothetical protein